MRSINYLFLTQMLDGYNRHFNNKCDLKDGPYNKWSPFLLSPSSPCYYLMLINQKTLVTPL